AIANIVLTGVITIINDTFFSRNLAGGNAMQSLSNRKKVLEQKPMNFWERIYLPAIFKGLGLTIRHFFKPIPTVRYPEVERPYSKNFRGQHSLKRDEEGRERCTACGLCALSCPAEAISMIS